MVPGLVGNIRVHCVIIGPGGNIELAGSLSQSISYFTETTIFILVVVVFLVQKDVFSWVKALD